MAKKLDEFSFRSVEGGKKYPWDSWLDGGIWELGPEDFGGTDAKYVAHQARNAAFRRGLKVRVSLDEDEQRVVLQSSEMSEEEMEEANKKLMERKVKEKAKRTAKKAARTEQPNQEEPPQEQPTEQKKGRKGRK